MPLSSPTIKGYSTVVDDGTEIGEGTSIWNQVYIGPHCRIGRDVRISSSVHIGKHALIGHRTLIQPMAVVAAYTVIGEDCFIGPGAIFVDDPYPPMRTATGVEVHDAVTIEDGAIIGAGAIIGTGVTVGHRAVVAMGSMVINDVPPEMVVMGSPARPVLKRSEYDRRQLEFAENWKARQE